MLVATGLSVVETGKFEMLELYLDKSFPHFRFAIFVNDIGSGEWFYDNSFGRDYQSSQVDTETLG